MHPIFKRILMKNKIILFGFTAFAAVSCTKKYEANCSCSPAAAARDITVEYRITDASASVLAEYLAPGPSGLVSKTETINKTSASIQFTYKSNNFYSITARNSDPSTQNITVDIYVDGQLFKSGSLDHLTLTASASGKVE